MLFQSYLTKLNGLLKSGFHKYVEEGQNIDEMAQEVEVMIESFGPPEKSALPETSSNLLVEDYQKGHKYF